MSRIEELRVTRDLLLLADLKVPLIDLKKWSGWQFEQAEAWAAAVYNRAADNGNRVPPKPSFLKKYSPPKQEQVSILKAVKHTRSTK
jgi:hypothetical protein